MEINCPICSTAVSGSKIDIETLKAYCKNCNNRFALPASFSIEEVKEIIAKDAVKPKPVKYFDFGDEVYIKYRMYDIVSGRHVISLYSVAFFFGPVGIFSLIRMYQDLGFKPVVFLFGGICLLFIYFALQGFFGTQTVQLTESQMQIKVFPFAVNRRKKIKRGTVKQVYTKQFKTVRKGITDITYRLYMLDQDGNEILLLHSFYWAEIPLFIERTVEAFWNIDEFRVEGQVDSKKDLNFKSPSA